MSVINDNSMQALILGGGGVAGIAWMTGLLLGMREEGVDLRSKSNVLIGTSAGSTVAAQIAGDTPLDELFQRQIDPARQVAELTPKPHLLELIGNALPILFSLSDPIERNRRIGDLADETMTVAGGVRREVIAARLPIHHRPDRNLKIVAVDIATGESRLFDRHSGVELVDAVAASCAVPGIWPPVSIGKHRYMDGGVRSPDNADFAAGYGTIVVISPLGAMGMTSPGSASLPSQIEALKKAGSRAHVIEPDEKARDAIGSNPLSPETRIPAAQAGRTQGRSIALEIKRFIGGQSAVQ